jgi:hypothetical protein
MTRALDEAGTGRLGRYEESGLSLTKSADSFLVNAYSAAFHRVGNGGHTEFRELPAGGLAILLAFSIVTMCN